MLVPAADEIAPPLLLYQGFESRGNGSRQWTQGITIEVNHICRKIEFRPLGSDFIISIELQDFWGDQLEALRQQVEQFGESAAAGMNPVEVSGASEHISLCTFQLRLRCLLSTVRNLDLFLFEIELLSHDSRRPEYYKSQTHLW